MSNVRVVTPEELQVLPPPDAMGPRHYPVPFSDIRTWVHRSLNDHGLNVMPSSEQISLTHGDRRMYAKLTIDKPMANETYLQFLYAGFHDQHRTVLVGAGMHVMVCTNDTIMAEFMAKGKNTLQATEFLPRRIEHMLAAATRSTHELTSTANRMQEVPVTSTLFNAIVVESMRRGLMPPSKIMKVINEFEKPSFTERRSHTLWDLLNAYTFVNKERSIETQLSSDLWGFFVLVMRSWTNRR